MSWAPASFKQRLRLDETRGELRDGTVRYLMLRADVLTGMLAALDPATRRTVREALRQSVAGAGGRSVATYYESVGRDPARLLDVLARTAAQLGWGSWTFETGEADMTLDVVNSPFAVPELDGAPQEPACHAVLGILQNAAALVFDGPARVEEVRCVARDGGDRCRFHAVRWPTA